MVEIYIDLYKVGYCVGYFGTAIIETVFVAKLAKSGFSKVAEIAKVHKIDTKDADAVTKNCFDCLKYID